MGIAFSGMAMAQYDGRVGITTTEPMATLDIKANGASNLNGILIPRVTKEEAQAMGIGTGTDKLQESTMVYISDISGTSGDITSKVDAKGFYYFDSKEWVKVGGGSGTSSTQNWEDIRYNNPSTPSVSNPSAKETITTNNSTIKSTSWFVVVDIDTSATVRLPKLKATDAGKMLIIFKKGTSNATIEDSTGLAASEAGSEIIGTATVTSNRAKSFIWDGKNWYPASY